MAFVNRFFSWFSILVAAIFFGLLLLYGFRHTLVGPVINRFIVEQAAEQLDLDLTIYSIHGNYLTNIEFNEIKAVAAEKNSPVSDFEADLIAIHYSLPALFQGADRFIASMRIRVVKANLQLDFTSGKSQQPEDKSTGFLLPSVLPQLTIDDTSLQISTDQGQFTGQGLTLNTRETDFSGTSEQEINLHIGQATSTFSGFSATPVSLTAHVRFNQETINLDSLVVDTIPLASKGFLHIADFSNGHTSFGVILHIFDGDLQMQGSINRRQLTLDLLTDGADLDKSPPFLNPISKKVSGILQGRGHVTLDLDQPSAMNGALDLRLRDGSVNGINIDIVTLQTQAKEGVLSIAVLDYLSDSDTISIRDARLPLQQLLQGTMQEIFSATSGDFSFTLSGAGPLLSTSVPTPVRLKDRSDFSLHMIGKLDKGILSLHEGNGRLANNSASFGNLSLPLSDLFLAEKPYTLFSRITGNFSLQADDVPDLFVLAGLAMPTVLTPTTSVQHSLTLAGSMEEGTLIISQGQFSAPGSTLQLQQGKFTLPANDFSLSKMEIACKLDFQFNDLQVLTDLFQVKPASGTLDGTVSVLGTPDALTGKMSLSGDHLIYADRTMGTLRFSGEINEGILTSDSLTLLQGENSISGTGSYRFADNTIKDLHFSANLIEPMNILQGLTPDTLSVIGPLRAELRAEGFLSSPHIDLDFEIASGQYKNIIVDKVSGHLTSSDRLLTVDTLDITAGPVKAALSGTLTRDADNSRFEISLATLAVAHEQRTMQLLQKAEFILDRAGSLTVRDLVLVGELGTIKAEGLLQENGLSDFTLVMQGFTSDDALEVLLGKPLPIKDGNLNASIHGSRQDPNIEITGTVAEIGSLAGASFLSGTFDILYTTAGIEFRQFTWTVPDRKTLIDISGNLPFNIFTSKIATRDAFHLNGRLELPALQLFSDLLPEKYAATGSLHSQISLVGSLDNPRGELHISADEVSIKTPLPYIPPGPFSCIGDMELSPDKLTISEAELHSPTISFRTFGHWLSPPDFLQVLQGKTPLLSGSLDMQGKLTMSDIGWAASDIEAIQRLTGKLTLETTVTGPLDKPQFQGALQLTDGEIRSSFNFPTIRGLMLQASLQPDQINISDMRGELGGSPFTVNGIISDFQNGNPELKFHVQGDNLLLYRDEGMRFRSNMDVKITGPLNHMTIGGEMRLTDGRIKRTFDFMNVLKGTGKPKNKTSMQPFSFTSPPLNTADLQLRIFSDEKVDIITNVTVGSLRPDLILGGTGEQPVITGNIYLDPTRIKMPSGTILMHSGLISITEVEPDLPRFDLNGTSRIMGYDITLLVSGTLEDPVITLSSSPSLPDDELLLLVLTGKPPLSEANMGTLRTGSMNIAVYLGKDMLQQMFSSNLQDSDESVLNRFELEIGRGITRLGEETVEAQFRLAENIFRDNDVVFLTAEKDIYDTINSGVKIVFRFK